MIFTRFIISIISGGASLTVGGPPPREGTGGRPLGIEIKPKDFTLHPDGRVELVDDGLARIEPDRIVATSRGRLLLRNMAMCFDHYLHTPGSAQPADTATPRFSRAI